VSDGDIGFLAVEDLGGGLKAGADMRLRVRGRENTSAATAAAQTVSGGAVAQSYSLSAYSEVGRDGTVFLSGPFGTITAGAVEFGNGITGRGFGGTNSSLPTDLNNGGVLSANAYGNMLQYSSPVMSGFSVQVTRADSIGSIVGQKTVAATGAETALGLNANIIGVTYANGPVSANIDSTAFSGNTTHGGANSDRKRTRISADYNFGFVKIGVGQEDNKGSNPAKGTYAGKQTAFGISAPITPALTVGLAYAKNTESGVIGAANAVAKGTGLSADYAFSKRTVLNVSYATIARDDLADNANYNKEGTQYRVRLMHSF